MLKAKALRLLQQQQFERIGGNVRRQLHIVQSEQRMIAGKTVRAENIDLPENVESGVGDNARL